MCSRVPHRHCSTVREWEEGGMMWRVRRVLLTEPGLCCLCEPPALGIREQWIGPNPAEAPPRSDGGRLQSTAHSLWNGKSSCSMSPPCHYTRPRPLEPLFSHFSGVLPTQESLSVSYFVVDVAWKFSLAPQGHYTFLRN